MTKEEYQAKHGPWAEVYTFVANDGTNTTIAIRELVAAIKRARLRAELIPIDKKQIKSLLDNNSIEMKRLVELVELMTKHRKPIEPIVVCIRPDGLAFIADGHHRFVLADAIGQKQIGAFICYPAMWEQYLITDLEPLTQEQLKLSPHPSQLKPSPWKQNQ